MLVEGEACDRADYRAGPGHLEPRDDSPAQLYRSTAWCRGQVPTVDSTSERRAADQGQHLPGVGAATAQGGNGQGRDQGLRKGGNHLPELAYHLPLARIKNTIHTLCEEVDSGAITPHIEIPRETLTFFKPKLSHVIAAVVSKKHHPSRLQESA